MKTYNLTSYGFSMVLAVILLVVGCTSIPHADVKPNDLLIDLSILPSKWYTVSSSSDPPDEYFGYESGADIWFNGKTNEDLIVAAHYVYRFSSERRAANIYERQLPVWFNSRSVASATPWHAPEELSYQSVIADQYHFACHVSDIGYTEICQAMGQYDNFLVIFHTHVTPEYMTYADIESILEAIDAHMATHLTRDP